MPSSSTWELPSVFYQSGGVRLSPLNSIPLLFTIFITTPPPIHCRFSPLCLSLGSVGWVLPGATVFCSEASPRPVPPPSSFGIHGSVRSVCQGSGERAESSRSPVSGEKRQHTARVPQTARGHQWWVTVGDASVTKSVDRQKILRSLWWLVLDRTTQPVLWSFCMKCKYSGEQRH